MVYDLALTVVRDKLKPVAQLDVWCGRDAPLYSILPSEHITQIGEHLLSLYQVF